MKELRLFLYAFVSLSLLLGALIIQQGSVIKQQRDLIRQMQTNPKCMVQSGGHNG